ncbi:hypothetical protein [Microcoleus sp. CAWBG51]|nr:hypothetical protein [Microcoleus sp. CAWBG51]
MARERGCERSLPKCDEKVAVIDASAATKAATTAGAIFVQSAQPKSG